MSKFYFSGRELMVEDAELLFGSFRNFSGKKTKYNDGKRVFNITVDPEYIPLLIEKGINVKYFKADLDDEDQSEKPGFVQIKLNYDFNEPPVIKVMKNHNKDEEDFTEQQVGLLDSMVFDKVDLVLNPHAYDVNGKKGITLYLKKGFFTPHVDPISEKYERLKEEAKKYGIDTDSEEELPFK